MAHKIAHAIKSNLAKKKQVRIAFNASGELSDIINRYREFYCQTEGAEITEAELITSILESVFRREKEFQKWLRTPRGNNNKISRTNDNGNGDHAAPDSSASSTNDDIDIDEIDLFKLRRGNDDKPLEDRAPNLFAAGDAPDNDSENFFEVRND